MEPGPALANTEMCVGVYVRIASIIQFRSVASEPAGSGSLVEAGGDDFFISAVFPSDAVEDGGLGVCFITDLGQNRTNLFNPKTEITLSLEQACPTSLAIHDAASRLVKTLTDGTLQAGSHRVIWDGTDENRNAPATGTYFHSLKTKDKTGSNADGAAEVIERLHEGPRETLAGPYAILSGGILVQQS